MDDVRKVTRQQAKKGLIELEKIAVNTQSPLHSHAERGNEKELTG